MASKRDMRQLRDRLTAQGFTVTRTRNGHYRVAGPDGGLTYMAATPSDHRAMLNTLARLRQIGFDRSAA